MDTLVEKTGAEPSPPSSSRRVEIRAALASALTVVVAWQRRMLRLLAPLQGSQETQANPGQEGACDAALERQLVGFLLTFEGGGTQGRFGLILTGHSRLGAGPDNDIVIDDKHTSTHHASLFVDPDTAQVLVEDDASLNGTYVNDKRVEPGERRQLKDDDYLRLGAATFIVKFVTVDHRGVVQVSHPYR